MVGRMAEKRRSPDESKVAGTAIPGETTHSDVVPKGQRRPEESSVGPARARVGSRRCSGAVRTKRPNVLLVDVDREHGEIISAELSETCDVAYVDEASDALERLSQGERYDIVFCDLLMPHMTGEEFYERARAIAPEMTPWIIFMAGQVADTAGKFLESIPNRCLRKPVDPGMLLDLIDIVCEDSQPG